MPRQSRLAALLLALLASSVGLALVAGIGWYRSAKGPVTVERLSSEERQKLVEELVAVSAGVFEPTWFEPALGYTLRRNAEIRAWNDTFESNEIGFRTGPVAKRQGAYRVLFVGDSWTFGMGIREEESFPRVFERLAREQGARAGEVEAWTLAIPGWNLLAELSALWFFFDRLEPDAVVLCPSNNDNHSLGRVLPNGSLASVGLARDELGDEHGVTYRVRHLDSYRSRERWRRSFAEVRQSELRLRDLDIPLWLYFVSRWQPAFAHSLVAEAGLESPYFLTPLEYASGTWLNPQPMFHGGPAANRLYGAMVYDALAADLAWPALPEGFERPRPALFRTPPAEETWRAELERLLAEETRQQVPMRFVPARRASRQVAGALDGATGLLGRAGTVLVRRGEGATRLAVSVRKLAEAPSLYPLELTVTIPSPGGGTRHVETVPAEGGRRHTFSVPMPPDLAVGAALDLVLVASRTAQAPGVLAARSVYIEGIEPVP